MRKYKKKNKQNSALTSKNRNLAVKMCLDKFKVSNDLPKKKKTDEKEEKKIETFFYNFIRIIDGQIKISSYWYQNLLNLNLIKKKNYQNDDNKMQKLIERKKFE